MTGRPITGQAESTGTVEPNLIREWAALFLLPGFLAHGAEAAVLEVGDDPLSIRAQWNEPETPSVSVVAQLLEPEVVQERVGGRGLSFDSYDAHYEKLEVDGVGTGRVVRAAPPLDLEWEL